MEAIVRPSPSAGSGQIATRSIVKQRAVEVLLTWMEIPGNYLRRRRGPKVNVLPEVLGAPKDKGITYHGNTVRNYVKRIEQEYKNASTALNEMNISQDEFLRGGVDPIVSAKVFKLCPHFLRLVPVFNSSEEETDSEDDTTNRTVVHDNGRSTTATAEPGPAYRLQCTRSREIIVRETRIRLTSKARSKIIEQAVRRKKRLDKIDIKNVENRHKAMLEYDLRAKQQKDDLDVKAMLLRSRHQLKLEGVDRDKIDRVMPLDKM